MRRKYILVGFSPTVAYGVGVVGLTLNQDIEALYTFAAVSTQPVMVSIFWGVAIMGAALLICYITWKINSMKFPGDVDPQEFAELEETAELNDSTN